MTNEKALIIALKIVDTCKQYGNEDRCRQCPFNFQGCIVTDGNNIPTEAIEKFKEYDEKHFDLPESMRGEIKVGDIVETIGFSKPVIVINTPFDFEDSDEIKVMNYLGDTAWVKIGNCSMTGRHIDKLAETFEQLKNE